MKANNRTMKFNFKFFFVSALFLPFLFFANVSFAQLVPNCSGPTCTPCHILLLISNIVRFCVLNLMPPLAGLLFLIGGIIMIMAAGSEERYKKGRRIFVDTIVGVVIVLIAWVIVNAIITTIGTSAVSGFSAQQWWQPPMCQ